jgi:hypothetical protein
MSNRKRYGLAAFIIGLGTSLVFGCMVGVAIGSQRGPSTPVVPTVAEQCPQGAALSNGVCTSAATKSAAKAPTIEDGTWTVGEDVPAGTYRTTANVSSRCYWQITKTGGDSVSDIVDNDIPGGGRPRVTLKRGQDFKTSNCGTWSKS